MLKKTWIAVAVLLMAVLALPVSAFAAAENPPAERKGGHRSLGQVLTISDSQIEISKRDGSASTFSLAEATKFFTVDKTEITAGDISVGDWVAVVAVPAQEGSPLAKFVVLLPADFDPSQRLGRVGGEVTEVGNTSFTLKTKDGNSVTVQVNENTKYRGKIGSLADLQPGMMAVAVGKKQDDGSLLAVGVGARAKKGHAKKLVGEILSVGDSSFDLKTKDEQTITIIVTDQTQFRSKDGSINGLGDLQPGMVALVGAKEQDGQFVAMIVGAGQRGQAHFDKKARGIVTAVGSDSLTIQTKDGEITFQVTADTIFKSRNGEITGLSDLEPGMGAIVGAKQTENGGYQAIIIAAGKIPQRGEGQNNAPTP